MRRLLIVFAVLALSAPSAGRAAPERFRFDTGAGFTHCGDYNGVNLSSCDGAHIAGTRDGHLYLAMLVLSGADGALPSAGFVTGTSELSGNVDVPSGTTVYGVALNASIHVLFGSSFRIHPIVQGAGSAQLAARLSLLDVSHSNGAIDSEVVLDGIDKEVTDTVVTLHVLYKACTVPLTSTDIVRVEVAFDGLAALSAQRVDLGVVSPTVPDGGETTVNVDSQVTRAMIEEFTTPATAGC